MTQTAATTENRTLTFYNTAIAANKYRGSSVRNGSSATGFATATTIDTSIDQLVEFKCKWGAAQLTHSIALQAFGAVVQYWLGSSAGSKDKDGLVASLAHSSAASASQTIRDTIGGVAKKMFK